MKHNDTIHSNITHQQNIILLTTNVRVDKIMSLALGMLGLLLFTLVDITMAGNKC